MKVKRFILRTLLVLGMLAGYGAGWLIIELQMSHLRKSQEGIAWTLVEYIHQATKPQSEKLSTVTPPLAKWITGECSIGDRSCVVLIARAHMNSQEIMHYQGTLKTICYAAEDFAPNGTYPACINSDFGRRIYIYQPDGTLAITHTVIPTNTQ